MSGCWMVLYGTQDLGQLGGAEFAGSAGPVAVSGEMYIGHFVEVKTPNTAVGATLAGANGTNDPQEGDLRRWNSRPVCHRVKVSKGDT